MALTPGVSRSGAHILSFACRTRNGGLMQTGISRTFDLLRLVEEPCYTQMNQPPPSNPHLCAD